MDIQSWWRVLLRTLQTSYKGEDQNDNAPEMIAASITNPLPEYSPTEALMAFFSIIDQDNGVESPAPLRQTSLFL